MLGTEVEYETVVKAKHRRIVGKVTGVLRGRPLTNIHTREVNSDTYQLRIKPNDGSRAIWTDSLSETAKP